MKLYDLSYSYFLIFCLNFKGFFGVQNLETPCRWKFKPGDTHVVRTQFVTQPF